MIVSTESFTKRINWRKEMVDLTANDLKKKQSVRATFKLPRQTISLLSTVAKHLGVKQKSLFDRLNDDPDVLSEIMRDSREFVEDQRDRQQKTFVISRDSLASINTIAKQEKVPRDLLVEISISRLLPIIANELELHKKRKKIATEMKAHLLKGEKIIHKATQLLGDDDRIVEMLTRQHQLASKDLAEINAILKRSAAMEVW